MNKKAINDQIFVYIFAVVIMGLIIIFGARAIIKTRNFSEQAEVTKFFDDIQTSVDRVYDYDLGSSLELKNIRVPSVVKEVCFQYHFGYTNVYVNEIPGKDIDPNSVGLDNKNVEKLRVQGEFCRENIGGKIDVVLEKKVGYVEAT